MNKSLSVALRNVVLTVFAIVTVMVFAVPVHAEGTDMTDDTSESIAQGLVEEDGKLYYYDNGLRFTGGYKEITDDTGTAYYYFQEDGSAYTDGYKAFTKDGVRVYYYFQEDGTAYTDGYLCFTVGDKTYYFYFQEDGSAFTGGYKEITLDEKTCYFYFLSNGQGFNTGYKTVMIDGKKYYFYFGEDGRGRTDTMQTISLGERTAYMLFEEDGKAFTGGYKEYAGEDTTDYYYFLSNGQAFTTGYKTVAIDGVTHYFYFEEDGRAFTGGLKAVPFGTVSFYYYFQDNGRACRSEWVPIKDGKGYIQANGRAVQDAFVTVDGRLYYCGADLTVATDGWFCVKDGYYFADDQGALATNTVIAGYKLNSAGKCATKYRIIQLVNKHTDPSMTEQEKINALYKWVLGNNMTYIRTYEHVKADWVWKNSWVDDMAASLMNQNGGNCYRYASFLGFLVREATGLPVTVYHGTFPGTNGSRMPHGWITVEQDGVLYVYDVELDKFTKNSTDICYKYPYEISSKKHHMEGVGTNLY